MMCYLSGDTCQLSMDTHLFNTRIFVFLKGYTYVVEFLQGNRKILSFNKQNLIFFTET